MKEVCCRWIFGNLHFNVISQFIRLVPKRALGEDKMEKDPSPLGIKVRMRSRFQDCQEPQYRV